MTRPASPYWREFVDAFDDSQMVHLPAADLRRLVDQLDALKAERQRLKTETTRLDGLRRAAEIDRDRMERQLYRTDT
jgi:uncharacterized protein with von Willebrand factor type A (vWA) domain